MAKSLFRRFTKKTALVITISLCAVFLFSLLIPKLNPASWWLCGLLGLAVPYLAMLLFFIFIFWLLAKPVFSIIPLLCLALGYWQLSVLMGFNFSAISSSQKPAGSMRIISWNVANMYGLSDKQDVKKHNRLEIAKTIHDMNADILCLQEFNHSYTQGEQADNIGLFSTLYPYFYYIPDFNKNNGYYTSGSIIFSKKPLAGKGAVAYPAIGNVKEHLVYCDIPLQKDTLRIFTTHLQSFSFTSSDYADIEKIKSQDEQAVQASKNILRKMKTAFTRRGSQADLVHNTIEASKYPVVMCGDFNDVPNSYVYFRIRNNLQDAFLEKGLGTGKTYMKLAPFLRIDYLFADKKFDISQFQLVDEKLSDHAMIVTDLNWRQSTDPAN